MWQTLSILAVLTLLFGSYLGLENRKGLADKISDREDVELAVGNLDAAKTKSKGEFDDAEKARSMAEADNNAEVDVKAKLISQLGGLQKKIATQTESLRLQKAELGKIEESTSGLPDGDELKDKLTDLQGKISSLNSEKTDLETQLALLNQDRTTTKGSVAVYEELENDQRQQMSPANLNASIYRSYQNFGFVILGAGYNSNIVPDSKLEVVRGDEVVGTLVVTSVEANQSAAQIDGESLADGVVLRAGDRVRSVRPEVELAPDALPSESELTEGA